MPKFRGYLRRLIIRAEEGFHGWAGIYICLLWSMLPFYSEWGEPLLAWQSWDSHKRTRKLCCAIGLFSRVTFSTNDMSWIQFSIWPQWLCTFVLLAKTRGAEVMVIPNIGIGSWCSDSFLMAFQGFISQLQAAKMTFQCSNLSDCKNSKRFKVTAWWEASLFQKLKNCVENTLIIIKMVFYWAHISKKQNKEKWTGAIAQWNLL